MKKLSETMKEELCPYAAAVVLGGGSGTRFGGDKLLAPLGGVPVLVHSLRAFEACDMIREIVVVCRGEQLEATAALCETYGIGKVTAIVPGGSTRLLSSLSGVSAVSSRAELVAVHDGARPLVTERILRDALWESHRHIAAVPAVPVRDTIKTARDTVVTDTPDRRTLFAVQTPQCFRREVLLGALTSAVENAPEVTDDSMAVERIGGRIYLTEGSEENIKITTPLDLDLAELIVKRRNT